MGLRAGNVTINVNGLTFSIPLHPLMWATIHFQ